MKANPKDVFTGSYYVDGDEASAYGAIAAGCKFFAGYPITPSTEIAEAFARMSPRVGGIFIQMEDEMGSLAAVIGASWAGVKAMTVTSGPGFSLMMEYIGLGVMMETPFVLVNIQRAGPSTGIPTLTGQGDIMQSRWGSHGDYEIIALVPNSPQELFDFTIKAFNLSEKYRTPVLVMSDECVGHMTEKIVIPKAEEIELEERKLFKGKIEEYLPFKPDKDLVPFMIKGGNGGGCYISSFLHDERGFPVEKEGKYEKRLIDKILKNKNKIIEIEEIEVEDAEVVVISYGISSRVAIRGIELAKKEGIKVGSLRLITIWPFPEERIYELAKKVKAFVVVEINYGQIVFEVERVVKGKTNIALVPHGGGWVHNPQNIYYTIKQCLKEKKTNKIIQYF
jgi:2-oxoglutarate ferredoxin oxidoreductase subunit alpha